jgi:hypothetical protein
MTRLAGSNPACWSWPLPTITRGQEIERLAALNALKPLDQQIPYGAIELITGDWVGYQIDMLWQDDRCAICGERRRLVNDHDHRTGLWRGRLCNPCNTYEGKNPAAAGPWGGYRERHPATFFGVVRYYLGPWWPRLWWEDVALARQLTGDPGWLPIEGAEVPLG